MFRDANLVSRFFYHITARPRLVLSLSIVLLVVMGSGLSQLVKDTSVKAFIPPDHPALLADERAAEIFGLSDTIAIAVVTSDGSSIFTPDALALVDQLSARIAALPNVRGDRVTSLATEASIAGSDGAVDVVPYIDGTLTDANDSRARWRAMPPHVGTIVAADETGTVILAELVDEQLAGQSYKAALDLVAAIQDDRFELHVGGPGAVSGYLGEYIDQDARKLQPLVFVLVLGFIYFAFRRFSALHGPLLVVAGAAAGSLGIMAWLGVPYYAITNALPVIVVAISVADAIHILSAYFRFRAQLPEEPVRSLVVRSMVTMVRPITLTTLTTIAGFVGIAVASIMPPITAFAWVAALGVLLAWLFSMVALPNVLVLLRLGPSPAFENWRDNTPSGVGRFLARIGSFSAARYVVVLGAFALITAVAAYGALQLRVDRSQVENFAPGEAIRVADEMINARFAGTAFLDVIVETAEPEGLLDPANMQRVLGLQDYFESLPHVQKTVGITDYLSLLHRAIEAVPGRGDSRVLPDSDDSIAQYLLVYEMSGDPSDFEEEIDYDYRTALLRGALNTHYFSESRATVEALQAYIRDEFNDADMTAELTGDVSIGYHWMSHLERSHFLSVGLSLLLVLLTSVVVFRSLSAGVIAVVPVTFAVLVLYAVMGYLDIYLEPATSMFAAIALGVGVDFGIHLVERMREAFATHAEDTAAAVDRALPPTARACFFNSAALGLGFAVLMVSDLPTLQRFGGLVAVAAVSSYVAALVIVPALFAMQSALSRPVEASRATALRSLALLVLVGSFAIAADRAGAAEFSADDIAVQVAHRPEGKATSRWIDIELTNRKGRTKKRSAFVLKENRDAARYTRITYTAPKTIRNTSFLSQDFHGERRDDNRWFYMPATRKVRRVPASDRGDYFLGTDFTYEDIQSELKFNLDDYRFRYDGNTETNGTLLHHMSGEPVTDKIAKELGYGGFEATIDAASWLPTKVVFFDIDRKRLKTIYVEAVDKIDGIWTATHIRAVNHRTEHQTEFRFRDVAYPDDLDDHYFEPATLTRGLAGTAPGASR